jgi:hypothetical protein
LRRAANAALKEAPQAILDGNVECEVSADVGCSSLGFSLTGSFGFRRQLKNRSLLTLAEERQEYDLAVRKFQCIVMGGDLVFVDLPKNRRSVFYYLVVPRPQSDR